MNRLEAHCLRGASSLRIQESTGVSGAVRHKPGDFGDVLLVGLAGHWTAHNHASDQLSGYLCADREPVPDHRLMVPVVSRNEGVSLSQFNSCRFHFQSSPLPKNGVGWLGLFREFQALGTILGDTVYGLVEHPMN